MHQAVLEYESHTELFEAGNCTKRCEASCYSYNLSLIHIFKCHKTYGYVGNSVYQIEQLLFNETPDKNNKVFYIGDESAYEINEWADEIASELGFKVPTAPVWLVKCLAKFGDFLGLFGIHFPMQSFRYENMTNDGTNDLSNTYAYTLKNPYSRLEGIRATIAWIKKYEKNGK